MTNTNGLPAINFAALTAVISDLRTADRKALRRTRNQLANAVREQALRDLAAMTFEPVDVSDCFAPAIAAAEDFRRAMRELGY